ncbi:hypothetical protein FQR65_LT17317 [Abscondita terminalis]|nr:hypothetical protein FQR65_LT17317 [Abscondita terminalis]
MNVEMYEEIQNVPRKKVKLWSAAEFRNALKTKNNTEPILEFYKLCDGDNKDKYITEYLEQGGNCLELFQLLGNSTTSIALLESINNILLYLCARNELDIVTYESCKYFLQTHLAVINKMISLNSSHKERKTILKLLTSIVTVSGKLAKEILLHVNFNSKIVEVLAKRTDEKHNIRSNYIHFLMSFFIEGDYSLIFMLLEKKYMLLNIFRGLQYDSAETVVLIMDMLYTYLVNTTVINKTTKMGIFSTTVIKEIVNLYNWKGPLKSSQDDETINRKQIVNASVHNLLLTLCTSHKYGVIFHDPLLGLGKTPCNNLMCTVLDSLEQPWEHNYASELVIKICRACPDVTKITWSNLNTCLEPRPTEKWLKAMEYAINLVKELDPSNVKFSEKSLGVNQLMKLIPSLVAPQSILKTVIGDNQHFDKSTVKFQCVSLLAEFAKCATNYYIHTENYLSIQDRKTFKNFLNNYLYRNFLTATNLVNDLSKGDVVDPKYLNTIFDLLNVYETFCPPLLENFTKTTLEDLLRYIERLPSDTNRLKIRAFKLFLNFGPSIFNVESDTFEFCFSMSLQIYCDDKDDVAYELLNSMLRNVGIFDDFLNEIDVWINGFLYLPRVNDACSDFVQVLKHTSHNILRFFNVIQEMTDNLEDMEQDNLSIAHILSESSDFYDNFGIKRRTIGPLIIGTFDYLENIVASKNLKMLANVVLVNLLHLQINPIPLHILATQNQHLISKSVINYIRGWANGEITILTKTKLRPIEDFSSRFLTNDVNTFFNESEETTPMQYLNQALFYFTHLKENLLNDTHVDNCAKVCDRFCKNDLSIIFKHPSLIQRFSPTVFTATNRFLAQITLEPATYLKPYRKKLALSIEASLKNGNRSHVMQNLDTFGIDSHQCENLLSACSKMDIDVDDQDSLSFHKNLTSYLLKNYLTNVDFSRPLDDSIVVWISCLITSLNANQFDTADITILLRKILETFPHTVPLVPSQLFESIFDKNNFCVHSAEFAGFLLKHRSDFLDIVLKRIDTVVKIKGLLLPLLESAINVKNEILESIYEKFEHSILKGLSKPNKAGPHFEKYYAVIGHLIHRFMSKERSLSFVKKVHKLDYAEVFHIQALVSIFTKALCQEISHSDIQNTVVTLAHATNQMFKKRDKSDHDWSKLITITQITTSYYETLISKQSSFKMVCESEIFNLYCDYCLKHGLSGKSEFLQTFRVLTNVFNFTEQEMEQFLEKIGAHSNFLEIALGNESECKSRLFDLMLVLCERWPVLLKRNHVPVLLSAYHGSMGAADRTILVLLQMYEAKAEQTNFYDFKPFLWGKAGAVHYSVRQDIQRALWRQPKMIDILGILELSKINNTIINHPLNLTLTNSNSEAISSNENVYNLSFFLPLFGSLLVAENQVALHTFVKSGALSLTILGLSCNNRKIRLASCHVLNRLYYHCQSKSSGKDKVIRICFIESLCRGLAVTEDIKINNFCSIFWARMALILLQPLHPMYTPLSRYLSAKPVPELNVIPELYTFLHTSDVEFKESKNFILTILYDGMRTNDDCSLLIFKMGFKLLMDLFCSCLSDLHTKIFVLKIIEKGCRLEVGKDILGTKCGLQSWLYEVVQVWGKDEGIVERVLSILARLTEDISKISNVNIICLILTTLIDDGYCCDISKDEQNFECFLNILLNVFEINSEFLTFDRLETLVSVRGDGYCMYLLKIGNQFSTFINDEHVLQRLVKKWINNI